MTLPSLTCRSLCIIGMAATAQMPLCMDIITNIFDHLIPDSRGSLSLPTSSPEQIESRLCAQALAASAQACRTFEGPALDRLWEVVDNVKNLLSILPSYSAANGVSSPLFTLETAALMYNNTADAYVAVYRRT